MASKTEICNLALTHLGVGAEIANVDTERSDEASACRRVYETALKETLRDFAWPFATAFIALGLVEEDPNEEWQYSYRYPVDCISFRRILSGHRNDTNDTRVEYKIARDSAGLLVYTDMDEAECEYTILAEDPQFYPPDFVMALSLRIAHLIAPRVTGGDPFKMGDRALGLYQFEIANAQAAAANEEQPGRHADAELIRIRES